MAEQDWLTPATAPAASPYQNVAAAPGVAALAYELRPLSLGELLDRTFSLYRSRFWLFAGIAAVAGAVSAVMNVVQAVAQHYLRHGGASVTASIATGLGALVVLVVYFLAYSVTQAATVYALSEVYLGKVATIVGSLRATASRWYVYMAIAIWQWCSLVWVTLVLMIPLTLAIPFGARIPGIAIIGGIFAFVGFTGGIAFGLIFFIRNLLATQATVVEGLKIRASMRRSKDLAAGAKGRIFVVLLISGALYMVFGVVEFPLLYFIGVAAKQGSEAIGAQAGTLLISFFANTLVTPVALIGLSLVYFDQRVRKEAFDIAVLLGEPQVEAFPAASLQGPWAGNDSTV